MPYQLINLRIDRIIIHQVFKRAITGDVAPPRLSDEFTDLDPGGIDTLQERTPEARVSRQHGAFAPISWGYRRNRAARYLVGALYFRGTLAGEFEKDLPSAEFLFPTADEDPILDTVSRTARLVPGNPLIDQLLNQLYSVA